MINALIYVIKLCVIKLCCSISRLECDQTILLDYSIRAWCAQAIASASPRGSEFSSAAVAPMVLLQLLLLKKPKRGQWTGNAPATIRSNRKPKRGRWSGIRYQPPSKAKKAEACLCCRSHAVAAAACHCSSLTLSKRIEPDLIIHAHEDMYA